jgi:hypothetical protein
VKERSKENKTLKSKAAWREKKKQKKQKEDNPLTTSISHAQ